MTDPIVQSLSQEERDRSPMNLSDPITHPDSHDYVMDGVRANLLAIVRAKALGAKDIRVDAAPVMIQTPNGLKPQTLVMVSIASVVVGDRIVSSAVIDSQEPKADILGKVGTDLYNALLDHKANMKRSAQSSLILP